MVAVYARAKAAAAQVRTQRTALRKMQQKVQDMQTQSSKPRASAVRPRRMRPRAGSAGIQHKRSPPLSKAASVVV